MPEHKATVRWEHHNGEFTKGTYSREHTLNFDGGITVPGAPALSSVPLKYSTEAAVDPEEAFVAAVSSCHMLTFLYLAYRAGFDVVNYSDEAVGHSAKIDGGREWVASVELHPRVTYRGTSPTQDEQDRLHHEAHEECTIANSVKTKITVVSSPTR